MKFTKFILIGSFLFSGGAFTASFSDVAAAHEGKLDSMGCHYARGNRNYHCHEGKLKGRTFRSRAEAIRNYNRLKNSPVKDDEDDGGEIF